MSLSVLLYLLMKTMNRHHMSTSSSGSTTDRKWLLSFCWAFAISLWRSWGCLVCDLSCICGCVNTICQIIWLTDSCLLGCNTCTGAVMCTLIARFVWPTWGPPGAARTQVDPMLASWILLSGYLPCNILIKPASGTLARTNWRHFYPPALRGSGVLSYPERAGGRADGRLGGRAGGRADKPR